MKLIFSFIFNKVFVLLLGKNFEIHCLAIFQRDFTKGFNFEIDLFSFFVEVFGLLLLGGFSIRKQRVW